MTNHKEHPLIVGLTGERIDSSEIIKHALSEVDFNYLMPSVIVDCMPTLTRIKGLRLNMREFMASFTGTGAKVGMYVELEKPVRAGYAINYGLVNGGTNTLSVVDMKIEQHAPWISRHMLNTFNTTAMIRNILQGDLGSLVVFAMNYYLEGNRNAVNMVGMQFTGNFLELRIEMK